MMTIIARDSHFSEASELWLGLSAKIDDAEQTTVDLRRARGELKAAIMNSMRCWGMTDLQITQELERQK